MQKLRELQKKALTLNPKRISKDLFIFIKSIENEVFDLNIKQLDDSKDSKGDELKNKDSQFSGVYSQLSEDLATVENPVLPKKAGDPYNFGWSGDFLGNFEMKIKEDHVEVYSTGEGTGDKKKFFDGYESLYGLTPESIKIIIEKRLKPYLNNYLKTNLLK